LIDAVGNDGSDWLRGVAAHAMGRLGDLRAKDILMKSLDDADDRGRGGAVRALGMLRGSDAGRPLLRMVELMPGGNGGPAREQIITALGEIADSRALHVLIKTLETDRYFVCRRNAAQGLGNLGGREAIDALQRTVRKGGTSYDGSDEVCKAAQEALEKLK